MKNVLIVCYDKKMLKTISQVVAKSIKMQYVDADRCLDLDLVENKNTTLNEAGAELRYAEERLIDDILTLQNCVVSMSPSIFISNDNFKEFKEFYKVYIHIDKNILTIKGDKHKIKQEMLLFEQISMFLKENCNFTIDAGRRTINDLATETLNKINL